MRARLTAAIVMAAAATATAGPSTRATITIGEAHVAGGLSSRQVGAPIAKAKRALRACHHQRADARHMLLGGEVAAAFTITAAGTVEDPAASGVDPDVATCVTGVLADLAFPTADTPTTVTVAVRYRVKLDKVMARVAAMVHTAVSAEVPDIDLAHVMAVQQESASERVSFHGDGGSHASGLDAVGTTVAIRIPDPAPPLDVAAGVVAAHRTALDACIAAGASDTTFTVEADAGGAVTRVLIEPDLDVATETCAAAVVGALHFPATEVPTRFEVVYARDGEPAITARETFHFEH